MRPSIPTIVGEFLASIRYDFDIVSHSVIGNTTEVFIGDTLYLRKGLMATIDGVAYKILSATPSTVVVQAVLTEPKVLEMPRPTFIHGVPSAVNLDLAGPDRAPYIYLFEIIRDRKILDPESSIDREATLALFYLDNANPSWNTAKHYAETIDRMRALAEYIEEEMLEYPMFESELIKFIDYFAHANFGRYVVDKGHVSTIFDENFSGEEQRLLLPIKYKTTC